MKTSVGLGCLMWMVASASCFQTKDIPPAPGGETNFLRACDKSCSDGLSCVCGVCTRKCTSDNSCNTLDANAVCLSSDAVGDTRMCEPGQRHEAAVCDARCSANRDCRKGLSCQAACVAKSRKFRADQTQEPEAPSMQAHLRRPVILSIRTHRS
jgi:hypothetical protein